MKVKNKTPFQNTVFFFISKTTYGLIEDKIRLFMLYINHIRV